ncbi:MAG: ATP synthase F1 subunit delta [bacterium]
MSTFSQSNYAKALFEIACVKDKEANVEEDLRNCSDLLNSSDLLREVLNTPLISLQKKIDIINEVFQSKIDKIVIAFIIRLVISKRIKYFEQIKEYYSDLNKNRSGIMSGTVISVKELVNEEKKEIVKILERLYKSKKMDLNYELDSSLIGGIKLMIGDTRYDFSLQGYLKSLRDMMS